MGEFRHFTRAELAGEAGIDPWQIEQGLKAGDPAKIDAIADGVHRAGVAAGEVDGDFEDARRQFRDAWVSDGARSPIDESAVVQRILASVGAHRDQLRTIGVKYEQVAAALAKAQRAADSEIGVLEQQLRAVDAQMDAIDRLAATDPTAAKNTMKGARALAVHFVLNAGAEVLEDREAYSAVLSEASTVLKANGAPQIPEMPAPVTPQQSEDDKRRQNEIEAFQKVFGRAPVSQSDWTTAAALDPHSYEAKNQGVPPNIVVGRIQPVPGQGVVRTNLFIPGEKAWTPVGDNLGDNRGFDPSAGPEESRVAIYTDYDNGIVVARQNPSVMQTSDGAQVQTGHPDVRVSQNPNGSVLVQYRAADPFSPGGEEIAKSTPWNVNGEYVIKPTPNGPIVGGTVSDFPAVEIYHDDRGRVTDLGHVMPQNTSVFGPLAGLPFSQTIGPGLMGEFPDTVIPGLSTGPAPVTLPGGAPHVPSAMQIPVPTVMPYPSVTLGPVESAPSVPVGK
ncbi:putative alpha/beta hydrolase [Mycolicibacterium fluoranthenivorans]|uniref:Predicted hydrolase N-terminal domain-containing protein n=1 Tax=Mycolicibacterium fluoranthenivorans TaxID=258505 RepID=A0A7X5ZCS9_9MYCO|nr:hypothetical protein [Mycolicibacterium fluoranthenivorans]MCV7357301.1 hypothetical protein [Mycolicibacterium fluoranthenivorans]NIH95320.1 hypothetical protein [Mycolicibacterium fluoranthenivorans]